MKIVYIAHPIGGDVQNNINKIFKIIREINLTMPGVVPFAPYIPDCFAMNDSVQEERERGIKNYIELFNRKVMDEVWLYGDRISKGMEAEIILAQSLNIPVYGKSKECIGEIFLNAAIQNSAENLKQKLEKIKNQ